MAYNMPIIVSQANKKKGAVRRCRRSDRHRRELWRGGGEGSALKTFINQAIRKLKANGTLGELADAVVRLRGQRLPGFEVGSPSRRREVERGGVPAHVLQPARLPPRGAPGLGRVRTNIKLMVVAEALVLVFALSLAIVRGLPGQAAVPVRVVGACTPTSSAASRSCVLLIVIGGLPALNAGFISDLSLFSSGVLAITLVYTAYVTEVYRAGIESVHPSQRMAARSLGLSYMQAMRFVVLPQAIRRVIPPLLNDFIGLQKDTALISVIGLAEAAAQAGFYATILQLTRTSCGVFFILLTIRSPVHGPHHPAARARGAGRGAMSSTNTHFVTLENVTKRFGDLEVLHGIDLDVDCTTWSA